MAEETKIEKGFSEPLWYIYETPSCRFLSSMRPSSKDRTRKFENLGFTWITSGSTIAEYPKKEKKSGSEKKITWSGLISVVRSRQCSAIHLMVAWCFGQLINISPTASRKI